MAMATLEIFSFFFFPLVVPSTTTCGGSTCPAGGPLVRFPFLLRDHQASSCGHPGFSLSCNNKNQTILTLPSSSGDFIVQSIDYKYQTLTINDPDNCLPRRFLHHDINLNNSPFLYAYAPENYTFVGCSSQKASWPWNSAPAIPCLTEHHYKVIYVVQTSSLLQPDPILFPPVRKPLPAGCSKISTALVPFLFNFGAQLTWDSPNCRSCEAKGRVCGLENGTTTSQIRCFGSSGFSSLPRAARYGIVISVGIPGLLCIIGLAGYVCNKTRARGQIHQPTIAQLLSTIPDRRPSTVRIGLDDPTIKSYPEIQLGESWELSKLNDNTCPICLSEYQPKETLRTIPECGHYFHANCIDEWLRMNATCPVCRNPQKR